MSKFHSKTYSNPGKKNWDIENVKLIIVEKDLFSGIFPYKKHFIFFQNFPKISMNKNKQNTMQHFCFDKLKKYLKKNDTSDS